MACRDDIAARPSCEIADHGGLDVDAGLHEEMVAWPQCRCTGFAPPRVLAGGDKSTQTQDIKTAIALAENLQEYLNMAKAKTVAYDVTKQLRTPEEMAAYLDAWLEEAPDDTAGIARALGDVARARNNPGGAR